MAKKNSTPSKNSVPAPAKAAAAAPTTTAVRNSAIPPKTPAVAKKAAPTFEQIALKAYFISQSPQCGNEDDNWFRAERELRGV